MSRESSTNPRLEDNGDIGLCDTDDVTNHQKSCAMSCVGNAGGLKTTPLQSISEEGGPKTSTNGVHADPSDRDGPVEWPSAKVLASSTSGGGGQQESEVAAPPPRCLRASPPHQLDAGGAVVELQPKSSVLLPAPSSARVKPKRSSSYDSNPASSSPSASLSHSQISGATAEEKTQDQPGDQLTPVAAAAAVASKDCVGGMSSPATVKGCVPHHSCGGGSGKGGYCSIAFATVSALDNDNDYDDGDEVAEATEDVTMTRCLSDKDAGQEDVALEEAAAATDDGMDQMNNEKNVTTSYSSPTVIPSSSSNGYSSPPGTRADEVEKVSDGLDCSDTDTSPSPVAIDPSHQPDMSESSDHECDDDDDDASGVIKSPSSPLILSPAVDPLTAPSGVETGHAFTDAASDVEQVQERHRPHNATRSSGRAMSTSKTPKDSGAEVLATDKESIPLTSSYPPLPAHSSTTDQNGEGRNASKIEEISQNGGDTMSCIKPEYDIGAKHSLSNPTDCQIQSKRGSGWGDLRGLGLRGGGETSIANGGSSGWGPPPANGGGARGWGNVPQPNPRADAAWGNPAAPAASAPNDETAGANTTPVPIPLHPGTVSPPISNPAPAPAPPQASTSWASAASKGLPTTSNNDANSSTAAASSSTSKHALESLQSVREALFSQDGWGGNNVKQDNAWDVGSGGSSGSVVDGNPIAGMKKDGGSGGAQTGGGILPANRNDGTDLWKSTLSGQPPAPKPQPANNPWGHTPQNPTDYKTWGEEDTERNASGPGTVGSGMPTGAQGMSGAGGFGGNTGSSGIGPMNQGRDSYWSDSNGPNFGGGHQKPKESDWSGAAVGGGPGGGGPGGGGPGGGGGGPVGGGGGGPVGGGGGGGPGWASDLRGPRDPMREPDMSHMRDSRAGWANAQHPRQQPGSNWSNAPPPTRGGAGWDSESPTMPRRDEVTAAFWGRDKAPQGVLAAGSNWKDMPTPNMPGPIRGPPAARMVPSKDPWGTGSNRPWGADGPDQPPMMGPHGGGGGGMGWGGDMDMPKRDPSFGWGDSSSWGNPHPNPSIIGGHGNRGSPGWADDPGPGGMDMRGAGWGAKPAGPKKVITSEMVWNSKPFRILCDMGCSKVDAESALRTTNLVLEDALELLSKHGRMPGAGRQDAGGGMFPPGGNEMYGRRMPGPGQGGPPFSTQDATGNIGFNHLTPKMPVHNGMNPPPNGNGPPRGGGGGHGVGGGSGSQPSAHQLKLLVQQIQMAVQAGHLNPQILNQPLAPQTLVLLNQLLQQIKALQSHQHTLQNQKSLGSNTNMVSVLSVDITKTKQEIQNLQNQISQTQANYLKTQPMQMPAAPIMGGPSGGIGDVLSVGGTSNASSGPVTSAGDAMGGGGAAGGGSRLNQWIGGKLQPAEGFPKAPGGLKASNNANQSGGGNLNDDTWGNSSPGISGWPECKTSDTSNGAIDSFGIPEFEPGKPWKGPGMKNPDEDPNLTPGSVAMAPMDLNPLSKAGSSSSLAVAATNTSAATTVDNSLGLNQTWSSFKSEGMTTTSASSSKDTWSNGPATSTVSSNLTPMGQDLWGKTSRTPPGLGGGNSGGGGNNSWPSNGWSSSGLNNGTDSGPGWLLLKNLTPQIDGSTLKTLCMQHTQQGPLKNFHLFLNQGLALVHYHSNRDAVKAQKALNGCLLNNTTIQAQATTDQEAENFLQNVSRAQQNQQQQPTSAPSRGVTPSNQMTSTATNLGIGPQISKPAASAADMWGSSSSGASASNSLFGGSGANASTVGSGVNPVWGMHGNDLLDQQRTTPLQSFLPNDLLGENNL